ncbi:hypothetical protein EF918_15000 [Streptomyces sp. WAC06614]|nr:hypothetical protein EF918_15000 [Streptomyces sp. WAC06614]
MGERAGGRRRWAGSAVRFDYSGAVYGSLLAASVIVGAGDLGNFPKVQLILLLLGTAVVFWAAHVFAQLLGRSLANEPLTRHEFRKVCSEHRPLIEAALPPAAAVALSRPLGLDDPGTMWFALTVAVVCEVGWAITGAVRSGAPRRLVLLAAAASLVLGVMIIGLKTALTH